MAFKINISETGKTYHLEAEAESLEGKQLGDKIKGEEISSDLQGYELELTGASDKAGFPSFKEIEGHMLKRVLLSKGKGMSGWKKRRKIHIKVKGLKRKRTVRGNTISHDIIQINLSVKKTGSKKLAEIFPEQAKKIEEKAKALADKKAGKVEVKTETPAQ